MKYVRMWIALALSASLCGCGTLPVQATGRQMSENLAFLREDGQVVIQFSSNGGQGEVPEPVSVQLGELVVLPAAELTVPLGQEEWRFVGWAEAINAALPDYLPGESFTAEGNLTLHAIYSLEDCRVTYRTEGTTTTEMVKVGEIPSQVPPLPEGYLGWRNERGQAVDPASTAIWGDQVFTAYQTVQLNKQDHSKYMDGAADGLFHPEQSMTRAEAAQVLYGRLAEIPPERVSYADVPADAWYAPAVGVLGAMGVLDQPAGGLFRPNDAITRGELALFLEDFLPQPEEPMTFSDVPAGSRYYTAVGTAAAAGLFSGYPDGSFHPDAPLSRAEATVVFNNLLEREPDSGAIGSAPNLRIFPDVSPSHWAYQPIMEATVSHTYTTALGHEMWDQVTTETTVLPDGYYHFGDWLYRVRNGVFLRSVTADNFTYDAQGRYTTGSAELDEKLHRIISTYTNDSMTRDQKLRALYNYVRDEFTYLKRPLVSKGQTGWEPAYAEEFLRLGRGNCYSFSATFCLLARQLGLPAYTVVGGLGASASPHGWVEIELDGTVYMFDPQLEWRYLHDYGRTGYNLFKMLPSQARFIYVR